MTLSKPWLDSSAGSSAAASTSSASRSRMAFWYSVRLSRRNVSVRPGLGCFAAAASTLLTKTQSPRRNRAPPAAAHPWAASAARSACGRPSPRLPDSIDLVLDRLVESQPACLGRFVVTFQAVQIDELY